MLVKFKVQYRRSDQAKNLVSKARAEKTLMVRTHYANYKYDIVELRNRLRNENKIQYGAQPKFYTTAM